MKLWPFNRRRERDNCVSDDLNAALWESERALADAKHLTARGFRIGELLRATGVRNHFGEAAARNFRGET